MADAPRFRFEIETIESQLSQLRDAARRARERLQVLVEDGTEWVPLAAGAAWAGPDEMRRLGVPFTIPSQWREKIVLAVELAQPDASSWPEALVYLDGRPIQGIDRFHREVLLDGVVRPGQSSEFLIEAYSGKPRFHQVLDAIDLVRIDPNAEGLYYDLRTLVRAVRVLSPDSVVRSRLLRAMERAYGALDLRHPQSDDYLESVREARAILQRDAFGIPGGPQPSMVSVGHAHLDLAWLWPVWQTQRKGARTFSTVLRLMDRYEAYHFAASQPALYEMIREDEPDLYRRVGQRIDEGRWEAVAATWVEMDCNIPGGEALVRQFLFGKRFCREELHVDPRVLFLPDVFGYSAALPQIMEGCGVDAFMTTKISWNEYNRLPYDTFRWEGIDGTPVLTHMVTAPDQPDMVVPEGAPQMYTYNGKYEPKQLLGNWDSYRQQGINDEVLYLFGYGDGGGGPTADMQETALRVVELPGFPRVRQGRVDDFFDRLRERVWNNPHLPRWSGELYLELHRGTYTSQGWIKRANRRSELLYREAELWSATAGSLVDGERMSLRQTDLNGGWKKLLFNQFHDILPGSSIHQVYVDARRDFGEIERQGLSGRDEAMDVIAGALRTESPGLLVFNPAPFERQDPVEIDTTMGPLPSSVVDTQELDGGHMLVAASAPPLGYALEDGSHPRRSAPLSIRKNVLENGFFRLELDERGTISSLLDKRVGREVIAPGERGNRLIAFEDRPRAWDAWDIQINYNEKPYPVDDVSSWEVVEEGPLRGGVEIVRSYGRSSIRQRILLYRDVPRIDFPTVVDWHERQTLLKAAFPVAVHSLRATFDIQWGNVERPTHWNTSWDWARFETCAHKWVDLSEGDYGVALLNDCKYGHDIKDHTIRLTLLRSPISPDPEADQGEHVFAYSLLPHVGDWREGETIRHAYLFNMPPSGRIIGPAGGGSGPSSFSFVRVDRPGVVVETIKPAEDGDGVIVRLYEAHNTRGAAVLTFGMDIESAEEVNMLEEPVGPVEISGRDLRVPVRPYGIASYRIRPNG